MFHMDERSMELDEANSTHYMPIGVGSSVGNTESMFQDYLCPWFIHSCNHLQEYQNYPGMCRSRQCLTPITLVSTEAKLCPLVEMYTSTSIPLQMQKEA